MHLLAPLALAGVQGLHAVDVVPDGHIPAARGDDHKCGWQAAVLVQTFSQLDVLVVGIDVFAAELAVQDLQLRGRNLFEIFTAKRTVAAAAPKCVCVQLPLCAGVFFLAFGDADVGIAFAVVGGQLSEK